MVLPPNSSAPVFWIFGGPNGSGKSTAYTHADIEGFGTSIWIINPDVLTARLQAAENLKLREANLAAVQRLEAWLEMTLRVHQSVGVETVLSTDKYRRLVLLAKSLGYEVKLFYVMLDSPQRNIERVRARIMKGGHAVPEDKIVERYWRSLAQLAWFAGHADTVEIYDNSGTAPRIVARKVVTELVLAPDAPENLLKALGVSS